MKALTLEIENDKLIVNDTVVGDEEKLFTIFEKAIKYDEMKTAFEELKAENTLLKEKLENVSIWSLSEVEQEKAGRALARGLLGGA